MKKKKGYTLVELIVAISIASILFVAIGAGTIFLIRLQSKTYQTNSLMYKIITIKDYIIDNNITDSSNFSYDTENRNLKYNDNIIVSDIDEIEVIIDNSDTNFNKCRINYKDDTVNKNIEFIINIKED